MSKDVYTFNIYGHKGLIVIKNGFDGGFLIVDDVTINNYIVKEMLQKYDAPIDIAESGIDAVGKIKSGNKYDIIFMDHMMPDMDGIEATKIIRDMGYTGCIVMLTGDPPGKSDGQFRESGFDRYITKPINSEEIEEIISAFVDADALKSAKTPDVSHTGTADEYDMAGMDEYFIMDAENTIEVLEGFFYPPENADGQEGSSFRAIQTLTDEDAETLEITAHGIKSALRNIGEDDFGEDAYALELAIKSRDIGVINAEIPGFLERLKKLVQDMKRGR